MKQNLVCLKLGGSVITDKTTPYTAKKETIKKIAKVLKKIKTPFIISHGSGSFGHTSARKYCKRYGYTSRFGIAKVAFDALEINRIVTEIFLEEKLPVVSFRPMSHFITEKGKIKDSFYQPIALALKQGLIPVVHGDVIWDSIWDSTIFSGETVMSKLCIFLKKSYKIKSLIELCSVDGVLDDKQEVIPYINKRSWGEMIKYIKSVPGPDVTGGMRHKVEEALFLVDKGISTTIINGNNSKDLLDAINNKSVGTTVSL